MRRLNEHEAEMLEQTINVEGEALECGFMISGDIMICFPDRENTGNALVLHYDGYMLTPIGNKDCMLASDMTNIGSNFGAREMDRENTLDQIKNLLNE